MTTSSGSRREFGVGMKDFCVYWFRRAADHLGRVSELGLLEPIRFPRTVHGRHPLSMWSGGAGS